MNGTLLVGLYRDQSESRRHELAECFVRNSRNKAIPEIHAFVESSMEEWKDWLREDRSLLAAVELPHVRLNFVHKRQTYRSYFDYSNSQAAWIRHGSMTFVLANADIYFDETFSLISQMPKSGAFFCLTRMDGGELHVPDRNSQDVWIWSAPVISFYSDFNLGIPGCDSRIAAEAKKSGLCVWNVGGEIRCHHLHLTGIRRYEETGERMGEPYLDVPAVSIEEVRREYAGNVRAALR